MVAMSRTAQKMRREIVTLRGGEPFTTSLAIAEGVGLDHKRVIAIVRKYRHLFEGLGTLTFQTSKSGGRKTEFAVLSEDQATFLMTLFKNSDVVLAFKLRLVKAFRRALNELARLRRQQAEPAWQLVRDETKLSFRWMEAALLEQRTAAGKQTRAVHYMAEAKLINGVLTGKFRAVERDRLSPDELVLLAELQRKNAALLAQGRSYRERRASLRAYLSERRPMLGVPA